MGRRLPALAASMTLLLTGGLIYLLFRPRTLLLFRAVDALGWQGPCDRLRAMAAVVRLPAFAVESLPGGLWAAAYVLLMHAIFARQSLRVRRRWAAVMPAVGVLSELLQAGSWMPGRFDTADLLCYALPYFGYLALIILKYNKNYAIIKKQI